MGCLQGFAIFSVSISGNPLSIKKHIPDHQFQLSFRPLRSNRLELILFPCKAKRSLPRNQLKLIYGFPTGKIRINLSICEFRQARALIQWCFLFMAATGGPNMILFTLVISAQPWPKLELRAGTSSIEELEIQAEAGREPSKMCAPLTICYMAITLKAKTRRVTGNSI